MSIFEYQAINQKQQKVSGLIESDHVKNARIQLKEKQLVVLSIEPTKQHTNKTKNLFQKQLSMTDIAMITRQLGSLIQASIPIDQALNTILQNQHKKHLVKVIKQTHSQILQGQTLAKSLGSNYGQFPDYYIATIELGEASAKLGVILEALAIDIEKQQKFRRKVSAAMIYPMVVSVIALVVVYALLVFIVPQIATVFQDSGQELPGITIFVISLNEFLTEHSLTIFSILFVLILGVKLLLKKPNVKEKMQRLLVKAPAFGKVLITTNAIRFARTFALLYESGAPVISALNNSAMALNYLPMRQAILKAREKVREGSSLFSAFKQYEALPPVTLYMLASGETSGQLSKMLNKAAQNQESEIDHYTTKLVNIFEPVMILIMGGVVLFIVLAMLLPIFELNQIPL
ncbi:General secretion pathway protein F [Bathymodiolus brooksi thiotrophic gill symbiont]|nr:General secretion pathway protein F [Bathymodiolus brooksi thiotrophic gill symbiont]